MENCNISLELSPKVEFYRRRLDTFSDVILQDLAMDFRVTKFIFYRGCVFSIELLQELFVNNPDHAHELFITDPEHIVDGSLVEISFVELQKKIFETLEGWGYPGKFAEEVIANRACMYWNIVEALLHLPPDRCFIYNVTNCKYKDNFWLFDFCFIVISGNEGLVLNGGASD